MNVCDIDAQLLDRFAVHLQAVEGLAPKTARNYREAAAAFVDWARCADGPALRLADVRLHHLTDHLVAEAQRGQRAATRYGQVYGLKAFFRYLVGLGLLVETPARELRPPRVPPTKVTVYSAADAKAILAHTARLPGADGQQTHVIVATFRYTGARASEVSSLQRDRLDLPARRMEVCGKGSRHRLVVVPTPLAEIVDAFLREGRPALPDTPYLFANPHPLVPDPLRRFSNQALEARVRAAAEGAGVPGRHYPHRWRHSFATEMLRKGLGLETVQQLMGHRSIASTILYTHLHDDELRDAVDRVFGDDGPPPAPLGDGGTMGSCPR